MTLRYLATVVRDWLKRTVTVLAFAYFPHAIKYANEPETILEQNPESRLFQSFISVSFHM